MRIVWNEAEYAALFGSEAGPVAIELARRALNVESQAKANASGAPGPNVQSGRLRASIRSTIEKDGAGLVAKVGTNVEYARYVEEGTPPHKITPRRERIARYAEQGRRPALFWPGAPHPVFSVDHPGTRAKPYLRPALAAAAL